MDFVFVVIVAVALFGQAQAAKYCCYPTQWESLNFITHAEQTNGTVSYTKGEEMLSVDNTAEMVNSMKSTTTAGITTSVRTINDYKGGKQYEIIGDNCKVSTSGPNTYKCIPDDARLTVSNDIFGIGHNQLAFDVYEIDSGHDQIFIDVVRPDCTPMAETIDGPVYGLTSRTFTNITLGIKDRSVFNIPSICQSK